MQPESLDLTILGIETSCDETGVAVYSTRRGLLAHTLHSQVALHARYGGVVPELASRDHVRLLLPLIHETLDEAGITRKALNAIAYTEGPGLAGALLVGEKTFGKGRTQRSIQLGGPGGGGGGDKALLLVSNRTFTTPAGEAVDGVGLRPAVACVPGSTEAAFFVSGDGGGGHDGPGGSTALAEALLGDPCVRLAAAELGVQLRVENEM